MKGLDEFPRDQWPDNIALLYYSYHIMVGLGTIFIAADGAGDAACCGARRLFEPTRLLWVLMLALPFPYIANTAGWMTAELGRQPWLVYGLMRTAEGTSPEGLGRQPLFTLLGFMGMYTLLDCCSSSWCARESSTGRQPPLDPSGDRSAHPAERREA